MIKLVQFGIDKKASVANYSPYCLKVEALLRAMDVEYEVETFSGNPAKFPKGKLPIIKDNGQLIEDSEFIYHYLREQGHKDLDAGLNEQQLAQSLLLKTMLEQTLSWYMVYHRWQSDNNWQRYTKDVFFSRLPALVKLFLPNIARKGLIKSLYAQGTGRFSPQEVSDMASAQLKALSVLLGEQNYFFGDELTSVDCCAYGVLANFMAEELNPQVTALIKPYSNLVGFVDRMKKRLF